MYGGKINTLVVKVGSSTLTHENGKLNFRNMELISRVICDIANTGVRVVLVSSGAQAAGMGALGLADKPTEVKMKQAAAAVGQVALMYTYDKLFSEYGRSIGQILLNRADVDNSAHRANLVSTFEALLELGVVPIVNENDSVTIDELIIGDNDTLSAVVAELVRADALVMLTDIGGLYTANPHTDPSARLIPVVADIDAVENLAGGAGSNRGTGGMATKLAAARLACAQGIDTIVASGADPSVLYDVVEGRPVGTLFVAPHRLNTASTDVCDNTQEEQERTEIL